VAARNEEGNIERCLRALADQDYPSDRIRIIAVNDESEDMTLAIMERVARENAGRITVISTLPEVSHARGKARAIAQGIDISTGEIILMTDADCMPPRQWARSVVEHFVPGVDVYGGFTIIESNDYFSASQQLDWIHLHTLASGSIAFGSATGVIGNNFAFRRSAYDDVGGYRSVHFTVTEDFALYRAMHKKGHRTVFPCSFDTRNITMPCESLTAVLRQKKRWAWGATESSVHGYSLAVVAFLMLTAFCIAPFVSPVAWLTVWTLKWGCDLLLMYPSMKRLGVAHQLRYFIPFELYFIVQVLVVPFFFLSPTINWKGRNYRAGEEIAPASAE
jgi:cellulose synthase/poly-beta-1,6-N-acetylglucosamine synthase-like glycosyltransferase